MSTDYFVTTFWYQKFGKDNLVNNKSDNMVTNKRFGNWQFNNRKFGNWKYGSFKGDNLVTYNLLNEVLVIIIYIYLTFLVSDNVCATEL